MNRGYNVLHRDLRSISSRTPHRFSTNPTMASPPPDITATPTAGQLITHQGVEYQTIKEGLAHILIFATASSTPKTAPKGGNEAQPVFYNPIQQYNRDLSVLAIKAYGEGIVARKLERKVERQQGVHKKKEKRQGQNNERRKARKLEDGRRLEVKVDDEPTGAVVIEEPAKVEGSETAIAEDVEPSIPAPKGPEVLEETQHSGEAKPMPDSTAIKVSEDPTTNGSEPHVPIPKVSQAIEETTYSGEAISLPESTAIEGMENKPNGDTSEVDAAVPKIEAQESSKPAPKFTILDALSATGLRALRYAQEIPFATSITANDLLPSVVRNINMNVKHNKLEEKIKTNTGNAMAYMYSLCGEDEKDNPRWSKKFDVIDLDPYGTAAPFLDAAVQAVRDDGGLLCVTCTDAGVWASNSYPEKAYSLYGGVTTKGFHSHEAGLRLILHAIATSAARYGLAIEPLLSLSIDFYARVFVRIYRSPLDVKFLAGKTMMVYNCDSGCGAWSAQMVGRNKLHANKSGKAHHWKHVYAQGPSANENCEHCGMKTHIGGPMYAGPIHSADFIRKILSELPNVDKEIYQTKDRIEGMLTLALEELLPEPDDVESPTATSKTGKHDPSIIDKHPFFFKPDVLAKVLHCATPSENAVRGALRGLGYRVTRSHTKPGSIKTDAPWSVIWEVMREWVRQRAPVKEGAVRKGTAGWKILGLGRMEGGGNEEKVEADDKEMEMKDADGKEGSEGEADKEKQKDKLVITFNEKLGADPDKKKIVRYQLNPRENWGPMQKAKGPS